MDLVAATLADGPGRVFTERFGAAPAPAPPPAPSAPPPSIVEETVAIHLGNKRITVPRHPDETVLQSARRGGLAPPFSCESGTCATCIARLVTGEVKMRNNEILTDDEVADGYILTCQSVPQTSVSVRYE
jgi:ferredoxin